MFRLKVILFFVFCTFVSFSQSLTDGVYAHFFTSKGKILLFLEVEKAPMTSANFIALAEGKSMILGQEFKKPLYNGVKFHRVIKDFMIQGGDPLGNGEGGPGYKFYDEFHTDLKHVGPGILSMANSGPNTNGSQFFITHVKTPWLDNKHSVFGHVVEGQNVVDAIQQNDIIDSIQILRIGKFFQNYKPSQVFIKHYSIIDKKFKVLKNQQDVAKSISQDQYKSYFFTAVKNKLKQDKKSKLFLFNRSKRLCQTASGLVYLIQNKGDKLNASKGNTLSVHYTGRLFNDEKFDSSLDRNQPFNIKYKDQPIISGFEEGLSLIGKGGKITLFIPYYLGYGEKSVSVIPSHSDLIFEIEVLDIK